MLPIALGLFAIALYACATARLALSLRRGEGPRTRAAVITAAVAAVLHAVVLYERAVLPGGLELGFFHALSLAAWVIVLLMLLLTLSQPVDNLGLGLFPLAGLSLAAMLAFGGVLPGPLISTASGSLEIHVVISIAAYAVLSLAAMQAVVLGVQQRMLHGHHPVGAVRALPPLYVMESLLFRMITIGFALLTIALATGFLYLNDMFAQHLVHKTVLSIVAWFVFAVLLVGHRLAGWRGPTAVRFTLGGVVLLVLAYFGSKLVLELVLGHP